MEGSHPGADDKNRARQGAGRLHRPHAQRRKKYPCRAARYHQRHTRQGVRDRADQGFDSRGRVLYGCAGGVSFSGKLKKEMY